MFADEDSHQMLNQRRAFHDGYWILYLWPKNVRTKDSCQVLDTHLIDI